MKLSRKVLLSAMLALAALSLAESAGAQAATASSSASDSAKHAKKLSAPLDSGLDPGAVTAGVYRNKTLGLSFKIPDAWVLRTDELNARDEVKSEVVKNEKESPSAPVGPPPASSAGAKVLLAVFSRPPEARGEDINASVLIAAETAASYPGLKDPAQYFFPLTEVAKAQGFTAEEDPYDIAIGTKTLVRGDFHKDVGTRVMHQSTLVMLSHGYAISITVIAGTDDEVEDLIDTLSFSPTGK